MFLPLPWPSLEKTLGGPLSPGLHILSGASGAGKTQLALQLALHAAQNGVATHFSSGFLSPDEAQARATGILLRQPWQSTPPLPPPFGLGSVVPEQTHFLVQEAPLEGPLPGTKPRTILWVLPGPAHVELSLPFSRLLEAFFLPPNLLAQASSIWILGPVDTRRGWVSSPLVVAKNRQGAPGVTPLRFNGAWFEDDNDELKLELNLT